MKIAFTKSLLCLGSVLLAETSFAQSNPLSVGDMLPPSLLQSLTVHQKPVAENQQLTTTNQQPATGNQFLILDFWATWCGSCLKKFPLLDSLQQEYSNQLKIILVNSRSTGDSADKINEFFTKRKNPSGNPYQFISLVADTLLRKYFPHTALPHYIWIQDNRVVAITGTAEITRENITAIINGKQLSLPIKNDEEKRRQLKNKQPPG